jgi:hypothetical protein
MDERVADDLRLLVDLLGHDAQVIALFREQALLEAAFLRAQRRFASRTACGLKQVI